MVDAIDTDGLKGILPKGTFGYDDYTAGGDVGRIYVGTGSSNIALASLNDSTSTNTANKIVLRDASGNFSAGTITATLSGNSDTSTTLATSRTIQTNLASTSSASFNGSANVTPGVTGTLPVTNGGTGTTTSTGSGSVVLSTSPTLVTPVLGVATGTSFNSITALSSTTPLMNGTATVGTSTTVARADHVHATDTSRMSNSQALAITGDVTASSTDLNTGTIATTLASVGTAGTYTKVTTDAKGRVTSGTTLSASDIPSLDASKITSGTIDAARLPSYVDDVIEGATTASFPTTGETGKIYVALDTNKAYRWGGSAYVYITSGAVDSVAGKTGVVTLVKGDVGLGSVDNTADSAKNVLSASKLTTARTINGVSFDGTANITVADSTKEPTITAGTTAQYWRGDKSWQTLNASAVGLGNVSNTAQVTSVTGTAPIVSSGGTTPAISISAATTSAAGSMSATDKTKLDGISGTNTGDETTSTIKTKLGITTLSGSNTGDQTITLTGDVTGSGTGSFAATLANSGVTAGTYTKVTTDAKGRITSGTTLSASDIPTLNQNTTGSSGSCTGNAATATTATNLSGLTLNSSSAAINPDNVTQNQIGYNTNVSLFGQIDGGLHSSAYSSAWIHQIYGDFRSGQIAVRGKNNGTWQSWRTVLDSSNYTSYSPSLTGTGASGTWGISVSGNASTATNVAWSGVTSKPTSLSGYGITDSVKNFGTVAVQGVVGNGQSCTTAQFITWLSNMGALSQSCVMKCSWDYSGNNDISDTGFGTLETAGCFIEVMSDGTQYIIRITSPSTGSGSGGIHEYVNHGTSYSPGWRRVYTSNLNGNISGNAATATTAYNVSATSDQAIVNQSNGNTTTWYGRILSKNSTSDKAAFLGTYGTIAGVFSHNNALNAWADLYVNTVDGSSGGTVRIPNTTYMDGNLVLNTGNYTSYSPSLTGSGASGTWGISVTGNAATATYLSATQQSNAILGANKPTSIVVNDSTNNGSFVCRASGTGDGNLAGMTFWNDSYAVKLGIRADGYFGLGGWSRAAWSWYSDPSGNMTAAGNVTAYSDPRLKENFVNIENPIELVKKLNGGTFNWKHGFTHTKVKAGKKDYGILANEVEAIMPEIVTESIEIEGEKYKTVCYEKIVPLLIEAIKEQQNQINQLKNLLECVIFRLDNK